MKNARSAEYRVVDHILKKAYAELGIELLRIEEAFDKYGWVRKKLKTRPKEGYFIWVKKQPKMPISSCVTAASKNVSQNMTNLMVVENNIKVTMLSTCNVLAKNLCANHYAKGKIIVKDGASLEYKSIHTWGKNDFVEPEYEFFLGRNAKLDYYYKSISPPEVLKMKTVVHGSRGSSANIDVVANAINSHLETTDVIHLEEDGATGVVRLRLVANKNSQVKSYSKIVAKGAGKGHLDCQGMLIDKNSSITFIPELVDENKDAVITHEASIGRISDYEMNYLRSRGLTEKEVIDLIVNGFLKELDEE